MNMLLISERGDTFTNKFSEIDEETIFGLNRYNDLGIVITV
jgi:hypothetical protein